MGEAVVLPFLFGLGLMISALGVRDPGLGPVVEEEDEGDRGMAPGKRAKLGCGVVHRSWYGLLAVMTGYCQGVSCNSTLKEVKNGRVLHSRSSLQTLTF